MCAACELINRPRITYAPFYVIDINHNQTGRNIVTHYYYRSLNTECVAPIPFDFIRFNYNNQWVDTTVSREREREKKNCVLVCVKCDTADDRFTASMRFFGSISISIIFSVANSLLSAFIPNAIDSGSHPIHAILWQPLDAAHSNAYT